MATITGDWRLRASVLAVRDGRLAKSKAGVLWIAWRELEGIE